MYLAKDVTRNVYFVNGQDETEATHDEDKFNNDVFIVTGYPKGEERINYMIETIKQLKKTGKEIYVASHCPIPIEIQEMIDGSALKLTTAKYYTPNDRHIHENGIMPDVVVEYKELETPKSNIPDPYLSLIHI